MHPRRLLVLMCCAVLPASALAGVESWRVNEVYTGSEAAPGTQYVELYAPWSAAADNCFFPSTRISVFDAAGNAAGSMAPFTTAACYPGDTYFLFATRAAADHFGVARDTNLTLTLPAGAGQLCFLSSSTPYDCVRWGDVAMPVLDINHPMDASLAPAIADGQALARVGTSGVVAADFGLRAPTPRRPNDGAPWFPPDAGPPPDADTRPDAYVPDAYVFYDSAPRPHFDARVEPAWLAATPGGGPTFTCQVGERSASTRGGAACLALWLLCLATPWRRRRYHA